MGLRAINDIAPLLIFIAQIDNTEHYYSVNFIAENRGVTKN